MLCLIQKLICLHIYFLHILWIAETAGTDTAGHPFRGRQNIGDIRLELFQAFFLCLLLQKIAVVSEHFPAHDTGQEWKGISLENGTFLCYIGDGSI